MSSLKLGVGAEGVTVPVRLRPRSSRPGVSGVREGALELRVGAPPVEGRANEEAKRLLARLFGIPPSRVALQSGAKSRLKVFQLRGVGAEAVKKALDSSGASK